MSQTIDNIIYSDDMKTVEGVEIYEITTAVIKGGVTEIGEDAFRGCEYLQSVVIPEGVTTIGDSAFIGCENLQSVVIPEGVTEIGEAAFYGCINLQSVVIPEGVTEIGEAAFGGCENLQSVVIPESVATIGDKAFIACKIENYEHKLFKIKNGCFLSSDEKTVLYCSNTSKQEIVIPEGVTTIGDSAFVDCANLQSVVIPEGVTTIGDSAFSGCENLQSVVIPEGVTTIGGNAFYGCKIENYEHKLFKIKNGCFLSSDEKTVLYRSNASKQEIVIPEGVTTIGEEAFQYCENLQSIVIPEGVTEIGKYAFQYCKNLQSVVIPEGVTTIGEYTFQYCENLQSVVIPEGVTTIGENAFLYCENLKEVHFGGNIEKLTGQIFYGCPDVELYAPEKSLTEKAIKKNAKLKKLYKKLEQAKQAKITEIKAAELRAYCEGIGKEQKIEKIEKNIEVTILTNKLSSEYKSKYAKITVPEKTAQKKLSEIKTAFDEVRSEGENVTVEKLLETLKKNIESFEWESYSEKDDRTIYLVKVLKGNEWGSSLYDEFTNVIISKKVKEIKEYTFDDCINLQSIVIPEGVTEIGEAAFRGCANLQSLVIPETVATIEKYAFSGCANLQSVVIPEGVTTIGENAFYGCKIENYEHKIFKIKNGCFLSSDEKTVLYCSNASKQEIVISEGVTMIESHAFRGCKNLQSVVIPEGVTTIGYNAFYDCKNLQSVVIPETVATIEKDAFDDCKIENYEHKIFKIKNGCFLSSDEKTVLYCTNASKQEIVIPEGVTEIGEDAFRGCANLQSVVIPEGVTTIGESAFLFCENLQSVVIPETVATIGECAFSGCANLQSVVIPESVATIGDKAFRACKIENYEHKLFKIKNGCFLSSDEKTVLYRSNASKQEIVIPEGVTTIGEFAFQYCENLQSVVIPEGVTTIEEYAFYGCENLQSVVIPEGVTEIGEYAFDDCTNLTVTFDGTKEEWEKIKGDGKPEDVKFNK